jgi:hypothetical protein
VRGILQTIVVAVFAVPVVAAADLVEPPAGVEPDQVAIEDLRGNYS